MTDRINLAELREELQAHENDDLSTITLGVSLMLALIDAVEAARDVLDYENQPSRIALGKLREKVARFDFGEPA